MKPFGGRQLIKQHPLFRTLFELKGNPKVSVLIEPLWGIPFNLIAPFVTIYMYALGISVVQIGILLSVTMVVQVIFAFSAGIITDKLGRKTTTMLGDFLGWVVPCIIWAFAYNFWFFLAAMLLNSFEQVNQTAWTCLLVEDAEKKSILNIYTWITIAGLLTVFFAPISGYLVNLHSVVPVMRWLYLLFALAMLAKCVITYLYTQETRQGKVRKKETKNLSVLTMMGEYGGLISGIFRNISTRKTFVIMVVLYVNTMINSNFFGLYVSNALKLPESFLAYFPILRAIIMLLFMFLIQHKLDSMKLKIPMSAGLITYIFCQLLLIFSPVQNVFPIIVFTFLEAVAFALVIPRKDSMVVMYVDAKERARIVSLLTSFMIAFSSPFGYVAGLLSNVNRRLPFVLSLFLYALALIIIVGFKEKSLEEEVAVAV